MNEQEQEEALRLRRKLEELEAFELLEKRQREQEAREAQAVAQLEAEREADRKEQLRIAVAQRKMILAGQRDPFGWADGKYRLSDFLE